MTRRVLVGATAIIGYWIASVLGHLEISLWLVRRRESDLLGTYKLADFLPHAGAVMVAAVIIWQACRAWRGYNHACTLAAWAAWLAAVAFADRFLIYSFPEYLHYPQYALLAWMMARLHDPDRTVFAFGPILLVVTLLGITDEALQYTWITISYSNYLDFNDFLLNVLGGIAGLLLHYGFAPGAMQQREPGSRITPRFARRFRDDETGSVFARWFRDDESQCHSGLDPESSQKLSDAGGIKTLDTRSESGMAMRESGMAEMRESGKESTMTSMKTSARYGLLGFAGLGTAMLLAIAALQTASTDPQLLQPIERQHSYGTWIPGPHAGRYYVLEPVTGTLLLIALGALASAAPIMRR